VKYAAKVSVLYFTTCIQGPFCFGTIKLEVVGAAKSFGTTTPCVTVEIVCSPMCVHLPTPTPYGFLLAKTQEVVEHSLQLCSTTSNKKKHH
jgi:hypothetical protein